MVLGLIEYPPQWILYKPKTPFLHKPMNEQVEEHIAPPPACTLKVDQIVQFSFFRDTADMVHGADPCHLIVGL